MIGAGAKHTLYLVAFIFNWITLGFWIVGTLGVGVIGAAWIIPMTLALRRAEKDGRSHIRLSICTLVFVNIISGILLLVAEKNKNEKEESVKTTTPTQTTTWESFRQETLAAVENRNFEQEHVAHILSNELKARQMIKSGPSERDDELTALLSSQFRNFLIVLTGALHLSAKPDDYNDPAGRLAAAREKIAAFDRNITELVRTYNDENLHDFEVALRQMGETNG